MNETTTLTRAEVGQLARLRARLQRELDEYELGNLTERAAQTRRELAEIDGRLADARRHREERELEALQRRNEAAERHAEELERQRKRRERLAEVAGWATGRIRSPIPLDELVAEGVRRGFEASEVTAVVTRVKRRFDGRVCAVIGDGYLRRDYLPVRESK